MTIPNEPTLETDNGTMPRCQHRSEKNDLQCLRVAHTNRTTHLYESCGYCEFTYEPCPYHDPTLHAAWKAEDDRKRNEHIAARTELKERIGELPNWAQDAVRKVVW